jgi:hypothetical protein
MKTVDFGSAVLAFKVLQENGVRKSQAMIYEESDFVGSGRPKVCRKHLQVDENGGLAEKDWIGSALYLDLGTLCLDLSILYLEPAHKAQSSKYKEQILRVLAV